MQIGETREEANLRELDDAYYSFSSHAFGPVLRAKIAERIRSLKDRIVAEDDTNKTNILKGMVFGLEMIETVCAEAYHDRRQEILYAIGRNKQQAKARDLDGGGAGEAGDPWNSALRAEDTGRNNSNNRKGGRRHALSSVPEGRYSHATSHVRSGSEGGASGGKAVSGESS